MSSPRDSHQYPPQRAAVDSLLAGVDGAGSAPDRSLGGRLASAEKTLRDISHALAHDVRTSLRHVASYAQLLGDPAYVNDPAEVTRLSCKVMESSRRLLHLLDSVAALSRLQTDDMRKDRLDTGAMVRGLVQELRLAPCGRPVECVVAPDLPPMVGDGILLRRVWQALLDNAWQRAQTHAHPRVMIGHGPTSGGHAFEVRDNGQDVRADGATDAFGLFRHTTAPGPVDPGSGLAMVRRIVECHGGRVWARSQPGDGTRFGFSLPVDDR